MWSCRAAVAAPWPTASWRCGPTSRCFICPAIRTKPLSTTACWPPGWISSRSLLRWMRWPASSALSSITRAPPQGGRKARPYLKRGPTSAQVGLLLVGIGRRNTASPERPVRSRENKGDPSLVALGRVLRHHVGPGHLACLPVPDAHLGGDVLSGLEPDQGPVGAHHLGFPVDFDVLPGIRCPF